MHGRGRQAFSDYKIQLREKQKMKRIYGVLEKSFRNLYERAAKTKGVTGTQLLAWLECRLDNVVYRLGFGGSRSQAKQLVLHGHVYVNGKRINLPNYILHAGDVVELKEKTKKNVNVAAAINAALSRTIPEWLQLDKNAVKGTVVSVPTREQMPQNMREQLVVELYSR
jgi:small subunit ribosomal protein S4